MTDKIYVTHSWYLGDFFVTPEYDRVEYYDHIEVTWDDIPTRYQFDLQRFGFAVPNREHMYTGSYQLMLLLWKDNEVIRAKEVPVHD